MRMAVLRSGGEYRPAHVQALARQVPGLVCMSDVEIPGVETIRLQHDWPGWWSKMELFRPDIRGDVFYLDLDTVIVGDIDDLADAGQTTLLRDFYWPNKMASGLMYLTEEDRAKVWAEWMRDPTGHMRRCGREGDQAIIGQVLANARTWQDDYPDRVVSYKVHVAKGLNKRSIGDGTVPVGASVVCFHGRPRPWHLKAEWVPSYA